MLRTAVRRLNRWSLAAVTAASSLFLPHIVVAQDAAFKGPDTPVAFIMDASRSMLGEVEGRRRMDVARDAMLQLAPGPLQQGRASLVSFGNDRVNECDNIPVIHTFGDAAVNATIAAIQTMEPAQPSPGVQSRIGSPLYRSIEVALATLPSGAKNGSIVMVTDGIDACDRNICDLVPVLNERGISVDILAIDVNPALLNQLACVPAGTGGALLPSDNLPTIESYARLLSRAAAPETVDVQPYLDEIGRLTAALAAMKFERDELENLRRQLDADLMKVFDELDATNQRIEQLETALANAVARGESADALEAALNDARLTIQQLQDRIVALDAAVQRCEEELRLARLRINELEAAEPTEVVREVTVVEVVPDPQVVAALDAAKDTLFALGCPFEQMEFCEPEGAQDQSMLAEMDRLRAMLLEMRAENTSLRQERDSAQQDEINANKTIERMISGLDLTASTYENLVSDDYTWAEAVAAQSNAGRGHDSVRANRSLMAMVSRSQSIQIIETDSSGLQGEVVSLNGRIEALTAALAEANDASATLRSDLNTMTAERDEANRLQAGLEAQLGQLVQRAALLGDERDAAIKLAEDRLAEIVRLNGALQGQGDELKVVVGRFNRAEDDRSTLRTEVDQIRADAAERDDLIIALKAESEGLQLALTSAEEISAGAIEDRDLLLEEISKLDHTIETLLAKNRDLQAMMDKISAQADRDQGVAEQANEQVEDLRQKLALIETEKSDARQQAEALDEQLSQLTVNLNRVEGDLSDARNAAAATLEENQSLVVLLSELRAEADQRRQSFAAAEQSIGTLNDRIVELEAIGLDNEAFFSVLITQCTALLGFEGDTADTLDRETLAFECAAAFESAQRWRADLTEMVELRDRSLRSCEARYASLDTRTKMLSENSCSN